MNAKRAKRGNRQTTGKLLLDAAAAIMAERQSVDIPLIDVADRADTNIAMVKYYFGNKEGLMLELAARDAQKIVREFEALLAMKNLSPLEKLRRHIHGQIMIYYRFPYLDGLLRALLRDASSESARQITEAYIKPLSEGQSRLLDEAQRAGAIRDIDRMSFFFATTGACHYLFAARATLKFVFGADEIDDEMCRRYAEQTTQLFLDGLAITA